MMKAIEKPRVFLFAVGAFIFIVGLFVYPCLLLVNQFGYFQDQADFDTRSDLTTIDQAIRAYAAAHTGVLPPMQNVTALKNAALPYMDSASQSWTQFASRADQRPFQTNSLLSQQKISAIKAPARIIVLYQSQPERQGRRRWVLFLDGTVRLIWETDWPAIKQVSGMR